MATPGAIRTLGFMFADLRGYTRYIDQHGDAAAAELVRDYRMIVRAAINGHGGTEVSTEGDSFFVVFESVSAAVLCGVRILSEAGSHEPPIPFGVGVHAGEAVAGESGYVAGPINVAARLCALARAGDLLVTDTVRALTRTAVDARFQSAGARRLKGFEEPVPVWRIEVPGAARASDDDRPPRFLSWLVLAGLAVALATAGAIADTLFLRPPLFGAPLVQVLPPQSLPLVIGLLPILLIADPLITWVIVTRHPAAARIVTRTLVAAGVVTVPTTLYYFGAVIASGLAGPLGSAFLTFFGLSVIAVCAAMSYGMVRRRPWVVGIAYVFCVLLTLTAYGLQPVGIAGFWAISHRRENAFY